MILEWEHRDWKMEQGVDGLECGTHTFNGGTELNDSLPWRTDVDSVQIQERRPSMACSHYSFSHKGQSNRAKHELREQIGYVNSLDSQCKETLTQSLYWFPLRCRCHRYS